jgi:hypothetical protein
MAQAAERYPKVKVEVRRILLAEPLVPQPGREKVAEALQRHARAVLGIDPPLTGVRAATRIVARAVADLLR